MELTNITEQKLYNLLPAVYRKRDTQGVMQALTAVIEEQMLIVQEDIEALYDNWFVETCSEWVLPYIGRLLGVTELRDQKNIVTSLRRRIANAIKYRRGKGTLYVIENLAKDVTGWAAAAVEFSDRLSMSQSVYNIRADKGKTFNINDDMTPEQINTPFDLSGHFLDISSYGHYNLNSLGLFLWRLPAYAALGCSPCALGSGRFTFSRLGIDIHLFIRPQSKSDQRGVSIENLPAPLIRNLLKQDLKDPDSSVFYGPDKSLNINVKGVDIPASNIAVADLSEFEDITEENMSPDPLYPVIAVDPKLGRFAFSKAYIENNPLDFADISVDFHYGFSADIGGGSYNRLSSLSEISSETLEITVSPDTQIDTIAKGLKQWESNTDKKCVITIEDSRVYTEELSITLTPGTELVIQAADRVNPAIRINRSLEITGQTGGDAEAVPSLTINGVSIDGPTVLKGSLKLNLLHTTIMAGVNDTDAPKSIYAESDAADIQITISKSILLPLSLSSDNVASIEVQDSIIDSLNSGLCISDGQNTLGWGPVSKIERSTMLGGVRVRELTASETIFTKPVQTRCRQVGYVRFCFIPEDSQTPMRYRCEPDSQINAKIAEAKEEGELTDEEKEQIRTDTITELNPCFTSIRYGDPGYAQLSRLCAAQIKTGAKNGSEIGAFVDLRQSHREENLKVVINEYLSSDLDSDFFYIT